MEYIIYIPVAFIAIYFLSKIIIPIFLTYVTNRKILNILTNDCDPQSFLHEVDKQIIKVKSAKVKSMWILNKSTALFYLGRFDDSIDILSSLNVNELSLNERIGYICNMIHNLLLCNRLQEADEMFNRYEVELNDNIGKNILVFAIKRTFALYHFYKGDFEISKALFSESIGEGETTLSENFVKYYLGMIQTKEGNNEEGIRMMHETSLLLRKTFYNENV